MRGGLIFTMKQLSSAYILIIFTLSGCSTSNTNPESIPTEHLLIGLITEPIPSTTPTATLYYYPKIGDGGFLSGYPCSPPCFFGIVPGKTTIKEAMVILNKKDMSKACEEIDYNREEGQVVQGIRGLGCNSFMLTFDDNSDRVLDISFESSLIIKMRDILEKYGYPSYVYVYPEGLPDYPQKVSMSISYIKDIYCIDLMLPTQEGLTYTLAESTTIINIGYSLKPECDRSNTIGSQNWNGYGDYKVRGP